MVEDLFGEFDVGLCPFRSGVISKDRFAEAGSFG
jgi:hypothetical protein